MNPTDSSLCPLSPRIRTLVPCGGVEEQLLQERDIFNTAGFGFGCDENDLPNVLVPKWRALRRTRPSHRRAAEICRSALLSQCSFFGNECTLGSLGVVVCTISGSLETPVPDARAGIPMRTRRCRGVFRCLRLGWCAYFNSPRPFVRFNARLSAGGPCGSGRQSVLQPVGPTSVDLFRLYSQGGYIILEALVVAGLLFFDPRSRASRAGCLSKLLSSPCAWVKDYL